MLNSFGKEGEGKSPRGEAEEKEKLAFLKDNYKFHPFESSGESIDEAFARERQELIDFNQNHPNYPNTNEIRRHSWEIEESTSTIMVQYALNDELRALIKRANDTLKRIKPNRKCSINFIKENYKDGKSRMIKIDEKVEEAYLIIGS